MKTMTTRAAGPARDGRHLAPTLAEAEMLARVFTTSPAWSREQLGFWFPNDSPTTLCRRLTRLVSRGILTRLRLSTSRGSGQYAYFLSRSGSKLLLGSAAVAPRGIPGHDLYHSLGVSEFYLRLHADLEGSGGELLQWWGQAASLCYLNGRGGPYINPDAAFLVGHRVEQLYLFEYDRAPNSAGVTQFLNKLDRYMRYYERRIYLHHLGQGGLRPLLVCLFADQPRMQRILDRVAAMFERPRSRRPTMLFGAGPAAHAPLETVWIELDSGLAVSLIDQRLR
jgi:hypothetical protein